VFLMGSSTINSIAINSNTQLTANVSIPSNTYTGYYDVQVYNSADGYLTIYNGFYVNGIPRPSIKSVNPVSGNAGQTLNVTITGSNTHFQHGNGTNVYFDFQQGSGTSVNSVSVINDSSLVANVSIPAYLYSGYYNVS